MVEREELIIQKDDNVGKYYAKRTLPDGRLIFVIPLTYGRARLCVGSEYAFDILSHALAGGFPPSRVGFLPSRSLARFGFHRTGSYGLSRS